MFIYNFIYYTDRNYYMEVLKEGLHPQYRHQIYNHILFHYTIVFGLDQQHQQLRLLCAMFDRLGSTGKKENNIC